MTQRIGLVASLIVVLALPSQVVAAVTFDAFAKSTTSGVASVNVPITIGAGANGALVLIVGLGDQTRTVSSISGAGATWAGSAFGTFNSPGGNTSRWEVWSGTIPSTGAQTVTVTLSGTEVVDVVALVWSFIGVNQATPLANWTTASGTGTGTGNTVAVTTATGDAAVSGSSDGSSLTGVSGCTTTVDLSSVGPYNWFWVATHCLAPGASTTFTYNSIGANSTVGLSVQAGAVPDTTPPSVPTGLSATAISSSQINLTWAASTDNVAVTGYRVFRGGSQIATVISGTTYSDNGLSPSTTYTYTVAAFDAAGNVSAQSTSVSATTTSAVSSTYYVDPDWGGSQTGSAATPWTSLVASGAWTAINAALASVDVTVYFSARAAGSDTNQTTTAELGISRTDTSTHILTLDGVSQYNTSDSAPSWAAYGGASKFQITSTYAIQGGGSVGACKNYITVRGFAFIATGGGPNVTYLGNFIFENNEVTKTSATGAGPGLIVGPGNSGPGCGGTGPDNVTVRNNHIHDTYGECLYIGASTSDPPGSGNKATGNNYLIQGNTLEGCGVRGGQGDGIDVKDGHTNLRIINNVLRPTLGVSGHSDGQGMAIESGSLIDGNYIEAPDHDCIAVFDGWHNTTGRTSLTIQNNICVNVNSGNGHNNGIEFFDIVSSAWGPVKALNNTIYNISASYQCVAVGAGYTATVQNNIFSTCAGGGLRASAGTLSAHDYNLYFGTGLSSIVYAGIFACASVASSEAHSVCGDPLFVSTSTPYTATNFKLQTGSPGIGSGLTLSSTFTDDYSGATRVVPWDMGAFRITTAPVPDTTPPTVPTGLSATAISSSQINLTWTASTDNVAVTGYRVFRGGVQISTVSSGTAYADNGLVPSTTYSYTVAAFDAAGNVSAQSSSATATTFSPPDTTPPTIPIGLSATAISSSQINLTWAASTDNVAVTGYRVFRGGAQIVTTNMTLFPDTGLSPSTIYSYTVAAFDAAGNVSAQSSSANATTFAPPPPPVDTTPPSVPAGLTATPSSTSQINLTWAASTDDTGVTGYRVFRGGVGGSQIVTTTLTSYSDTGRSPSTTYTYTVAAFDAAGNASAQSPSVSGTTLSPPPDTSPPSVPLGLTVTSISSSRISLAWTASTDDVGVTGYRVFRGGTQITTATITSFSDTGLSPSTGYSYTVAAFDAAGNVSGQSLSVTGTTSSGVVSGGASVVAGVGAVGSLGTIIPTR